METKDLVLLLMIPIFMVGIITFVNHNSITGAVVAGPDDNENLGTYSIMPSFRAKIDYNLQDYSELNNKLKAAIDKCKILQNVRDCIKAETDRYGWGCNPADSDVLYDFTGKLKECSNLDKENVVCRFSFDSMDYINKENSKRDFEINLTGWHYPRIKAELIENDKILATEFLNPGSLDYTDYENKDKRGNDVDSVIVKVHYENGIPSVQDNYATVGGKTAKLSKIFLIYKSKDGIKFIDENFEPSFRGPEPANTIIDLPLMQGLKFCAKTGKNIIAYDSSDGLVRLREIVYRFAVTLPTPVPAPVNSFEVKDNLKAENSALLIWKKDSQAGTKSYSIYYSTKDFADVKISDIKKDDEIKRVSVPISNPVEIERIELDSCEFNPINEPCKYPVYNQALLENKLYYIKSENKFVYVFSDAGFKDGIDYNIAITAVNDQDEEIDNDKSIKGNKNILELNKNYVKFTPADDLAPGKVLNLQASSPEKGKAKLTWNLPDKNIDGTDNKDASAFNVYYLKQEITPNPTSEYNRVLGSIPKSSCEGKPSCEYTFNSLESGKTYFFAVSAIDSNKNEYFEIGGYSTTMGVVQ